MNLKKKPMPAEILVPTAWLLTLLALSKKVNGQIEKMSPIDHTVLFKTDISALTGYASSAETILKYPRV